MWKWVTVALDRVVFPPLRRWNGESVPVCLGGSHFSASTGRSIQLVGHWILQKQCIFSSSLWNTGSAPHPFEDIWACVGVWPTSLHVVCGLWSWSSVNKCLLWVGNKLLHQVSWGFVHEWGKSGAGDLQMDWCSFSSDVVQTTTGSCDLDKWQKLDRWVEKDNRHKSCYKRDVYSGVKWKWEKTVVLQEFKSSDLTQCALSAPVYF